MRVDAPETSFMRAVVEVFRRLGQTLGPLAVPVRAVLVGGAAVHVYTRSRVSADVDAIFSHRILVPGDLLAEWDDEGQRRALTFDPNFFHALALMHPDAEADALPLGVEPWPNLKLHLDEACGLVEIASADGGAR